jgi:hypothetical protein
MQQFINYNDPIANIQLSNFYDSLSSSDKSSLRDAGIDDYTDINVNSVKVGKSVNRMILFNSS